MLGYCSLLLIKLNTVADSGDQFSLRIFYEAGTFLAKHILGLLPRVDKVREEDCLKSLLVHNDYFLDVACNAL